MSVVIKVENISKQYRLGDVGTGALAHDVNKWWHKVRGKENPYLKIGETNNRAAKGDSDYVWALKDINFEVEQGEVLGIIGRNGAGKSTLLKILSKTTTATTGSIKIKGKIASLLEVGTGFHPELSGRENVFLNGAILGMTKREIKSKFDEIVDFAGVERYIDTPVKRYSSGMYVRLAFGVAAHLEPEILIVDEVLAVGDAEFQKKALGKMKEVSEKGGRTVLFVSHNISAIKSLCNKCILMEQGRITSHDNTQKVVYKYFETSNIKNEYVHKSGKQEIKIQDLLINGSKASKVKIYQKIEIDIYFSKTEQAKKNVEFFVLISNEEGEFIESFFECDVNNYTDVVNLTGRKKVVFDSILIPGKYYVSVGVLDYRREFYDWVEYCESFNVEELYDDQRIYKQRLGLIVGKSTWQDL